MDDFPLSAQLIALCILLLASAFFSLAETSMMALNRYRLKALVRLGSRGAKLTTDLLAHTDRLLGHSARQHAGRGRRSHARSAHRALALGRSWVPAASAVAVTFALLVVSEITPKVIGAAYAEQIACRSHSCSPPLKALYPVVWFESVCALAVLAIPVEIRRYDGKQADFEELHAGARSRYHILSKHQSILLNLFDLESITVDDVMIPRNQIEVPTLMRHPKYC
jgi:Mg2+/Co2+ transporter CorB